MSEDEAIKELKEILEYKKTTIDTIEDPIQREIEENCYIWEMPFNAIEIILDLYKQEKEKNKELEENYDKLTKHFIKNHISKDKIKAKIEEVNSINENYTFERLTSADIRRTISTNLQELLEEE